MDKQNFPPTAFLESNKTEKLNVPKKIDRYHIKEIIGQGGMGCVYKAFDPQINKFVALKVMLSGNSQQEIKRFIIEIKAMAKINHPNIVKIYNTGVDNNTPFFTMDYIEGLSLKEYLKITPLNIRSYLQLMIKIGKAVAYVHQQGIIHRDLKPANIIIDLRREMPYVMDFGLAKVVSSNKSLSKKGALLGTPQYMSPEQARGEKSNHLTDVYALGAILYEILSQKPLIRAGSITEVIFRVVHQEPKTLREINKNLSRDLETICSKAIAKDKTKRYQSTQTFIEDLDKFLNGELISARPAGVIEKSWKKCKKNKAIVAAVIIAILLLFAGIFTVKTYQTKGKNTLVKKWLSSAHKLEKEAQKKPAIIKIELYVKAGGYLEKALEISPQQQIRKKLFQIQHLIGELAKEQKNYLLSYRIFKKCQKLGDPKAKELLKALQLDKNKAKKEHKVFIDNAMLRVANAKLQETTIHWYVSRIVKLQTPFTAKTLLFYLQKNNRWQRKLAIRTLGKLGNVHTKFKGKDCVVWLLELLARFKDKKAVDKHQEEVEEIINALGWLKDSRASKQVYDIRWLAGLKSVLWHRTEMAYKRIPFVKKVAKSADEFFTRAQMRAQKKDYLGAIADFTKAISFHPDYALTYNTRGSVYFDIKEYTKAIADFDKAISLDPKFTDAYNNKGLSYQRLKEYSKALANFTQAIAINPRYHTAYNNRGYTYYLNKQHHKAIADFNQAITLNPKYIEAYRNRGSVYLETGEYSKAIADCTKAIFLNPRSTRSYGERALAYHRAQLYQKALADYAQAISLAPRWGPLYYNRGNTYQALKEYAKAITDYTRSISFNPKDVQSYVNRGNTYQNIKEHYKAIADYTQAIFINPRFSKAYYNRGNAYFHLKKYHKAIANYTKAIAIYPQCADAYYTKGVVYMHLKQYQKTYENFSMLLKLNPNDPNAAKIQHWIKQSKQKGLIK